MCPCTDRSVSSGDGLPPKPKPQEFEESLFHAFPVVTAKKLPLHGACGSRTDADPDGAVFGVVCSAHTSSPSPLAMTTLPINKASPPSTSRLQSAPSCNKKRDLSSFLRDEVSSPTSTGVPGVDRSISADEPKAALMMPCNFWSLPHAAYLNSAENRVTSTVFTTTNTVNDSFDRLFVKRCKKVDFK